MRNFLTRSACILVSPALLLACSDEPSPEAAGVPERFRSFVDRFENERRELGVPGAAVAILEGGEISFAHGFGTKGVDSLEPVDAATIFRTGSMGKVVTAIGVMSAVDDGDLDLDAPIRAAIPDLSLTGPDSDALTLRVLMSQQSGLRDYLEIQGSAEDAGLAAFTSGPALPENVDFISPPGLFWNYSNPNFTLAGRALEAQAGVPYPTAIRDRVFTPLGMDRSFLLPGDVLADGNYTHGYGVNSITGDGPLEDLGPDAYDNAWARPAGYAFSNVLDWAKLMQFLMAGDTGVLSGSAHEEVVRSQVSTHNIYADVKETALGLGDDYGLGVGVGEGFFVDRRAEPETYYAMPFLGHGGDIPGFATTFAVFPSTGFGIVVLSNRDAARPVEAIRFAMESFGDLPDPSAPPPGREVDRARFTSYAGDFVTSDDVAIAVRENASGELEVETDVLDGIGVAFEPVLEPTSLDNFALWLTIGGERFPLEVTFFANEAGDYEWFRSRIAVARRAEALATSTAAGLQGPAARGVGTGVGSPP